MSINSYLSERCENKCEMCGSTNDLDSYAVPPKSGEELDHQVALCNTCLSQVNDPSTMDKNHWRCLNDSMWSQVPSVQVLSYRMLNELATEGWAQDAIGMMYMDDETMEWAKQAGDVAVVHKDSNGHVLLAGDSIVLIKDLNVKGASFVAKRGTAVRRIHLVADNPGQIEGKIDGQHIVLLTEFVKKTN